MGCFIRKQKTLESFDSSVFIFAEIYLIYFLLKTSAAISLEKLKKRTTMSVLREICFTNAF